MRLQKELQHKSTHANRRFWGTWVAHSSQWGLRRLSSLATPLPALEDDGMQLPYIQKKRAVGEEKKATPLDLQPLLLAILHSTPQDVEGKTQIDENQACAKFLQNVLNMDYLSSLV